MVTVSVDEPMPKQIHILEGESVEDFDALSKKIHAEFDPVTHTERTLVEMLVQHEWLMRRAVRMQEVLEAAIADGMESDPKRTALVQRYFKSHRKAFADTKRQLENMRKFKKKMDALETRAAATTNLRQRQWEQVLKKMPPLTNWVN